MKKTFKWLSFIVILAMLTCFTLSFVGCTKDSVDDQRVDEVETQDNIVNDEEEEQNVGEEASLDSPLYLETVSKTFEDEFFLSGNATPSGMQLVASVSGYSDGRFKMVWSYAWSPDADSNGWHSGKDVDDYISFTESVDNTNIVYIDVKQGFKTRILVSCQIEGTTKFASCDVCYADRLDKEHIQFGYIFDESDNNQSSKQFFTFGNGVWDLYLSHDIPNVYDTVYSKPTIYDPLYSVSYNGEVLYGRSFGYFDVNWYKEQFCHENSCNSVECFIRPSASLSSALWYAFRGNSIDSAAEYADLLDSDIPMPVFYSNVLGFDLAGIFSSLTQCLAYGEDFDENWTLFKNCILQSHDEYDFLLIFEFNFEFTTEYVTLQIHIDRDSEVFSYGVNVSNSELVF